MKERAHYIDAVKGIGILCITLLHFEEGIFPQWLNVWIGMFMITTFYFTSGWITGLQNKNITPKELFKKRIKQLGIPYLWFSLLILVFDLIFILAGFMDLQALLKDIYKTICLKGIGTLWFLPVLLTGEMLFCIIRNSKHKFWAVLIGLALTISITVLYYNILRPMRDVSILNKFLIAPLQFITSSFSSWPIIAIGYLFSKYIWVKFKNLKKIFYLLVGVSAIAFSILLIISPPFSIYYVNRVFSNVLPVLGFILIFATIGNKNFLSNFLSFWGVNSLILMCTHYSILMEIFKIIDLKCVHSNFTGYTTIIYFIATIILTYPLVWLFNGKLKFMIGK